MITIEQMNFNAKEAFYKDLTLHPAVKCTFPMIFHPVFQRSILGISQIVEESTQKGLILNLQPFGEFRAFGSLEAALLVFPEFQRQGIGKSAISLLSADRISTFFVSATSNKASYAFFKKQTVLTLTHQNNRYRIFKTAA